MCICATVFQQPARDFISLHLFFNCVRDDYFACNPIHLFMYVCLCVIGHTISFSSHAQDTYALLAEDLAGRFAAPSASSV